MRVGLFRYLLWQNLTLGRETLRRAKCIEKPLETFHQDDGPTVGGTYLTSIYIGLMHSFMVGLVFRIGFFKMNFG